MSRPEERMACADDTCRCGASVRGTSGKSAIAASPSSRAPLRTDRPRFEIIADLKTAAPATNEHPSRGDSAVVLPGEDLCVRHIPDGTGIRKRAEQDHAASCSGHRRSQGAVKNGWATWTATQVDPSHVKVESLAKGENGS
jgi:hypothetical protein